MKLASAGCAAACRWKQKRGESGSRVSGRLVPVHPGRLTLDGGQPLAVPYPWLLAEARHDRVPHVRLGRYVRFDPDELECWWRARMRGPTVDSHDKRPRAADTAGGHGPRRTSSMSSRNANSRRAYGSGRLTVRAGTDGSETWYGLWRVNGRRVKRLPRTREEPVARRG